MQAFPHHYEVSASASPDSQVALTSDGLDTLEAAPPREFDGPGDLWSPESLATAAIASCFILTFKAVAKGSKFTWVKLDVDVTGTLDRVDRVTRFTGIMVRPKLTVPADTDKQLALRLLEKAEENCLITNSFSAEASLDATVILE